MILKVWLLRNKITPAQFAGRLEVSRNTVYAWARGEKVPGRRFIAIIARVTNGSVTVKDWELAMGGNDKLYTISQIATYAHVQPRTVYAAVRKGLVKASKPAKRWMLSKKDYDEYRMFRHSGEDRKVNGERIFDLAGGRYSVMVTSKILGERLNKRITRMRVYYLIRQGRLKAQRVKSAWMVRREDVEAYLASIGRGEENGGQLRFG